LPRGRIALLAVAVAVAVAVAAGGRRISTLPWPVFTPCACDNVTPAV
jgi:hypothetical protein